MIEITRFILAAIVAETHIWPLGFTWAGWQAVFAFYTLSGYLMTRVLNARYGFTLQGISTFALNRILRLWPAYLVVIGLTFIALLFLPLDKYSGLIRVPRTPWEIISNLTILGSVTFDYLNWIHLARLAITSWSLSIELFAYALLALFFAKSPSRLFLFVAIGVIGLAVSTAVCANSSDPAAYGPYCFQNRYGVLHAGFIPFAVGGLLYFYYDDVREWLIRKPVTILVVLLVVEVACVKNEFFNNVFGPFIGCAIMILILLRGVGDQLTPVRDFFGRASYHLFIAHMSVGATLAVLSPRLVGARGYFLTVFICLGLSCFLVPLERRINIVRGRVRSKLKPKPVPSDKRPLRTVNPEEVTG
jgi:peptidoglycan/LPS O-acetylase OafA/YrhL